MSHDTAGPTDNKATFIAWGLGGVGHYRGALPARYTNSGLFLRHDRTLEVIKDIGVRNAPVMIVNNPWLDFQIAECLEIIKGGGKLIIDVDDLLRSCIGKEDMLAQFTEEVVDKHEALLKEAHLVSCSTQHIADDLKNRLGVRTHVCPNGIDLERFNVRKFPRNKQATIVGWAGSGGHLEALQRVAPAIERVMDAKSDVAFVSLGAPSVNLVPSSLLGKYAESERVGDAGWHGLYDYPTIMSQFHIGLAPAVDNGFYRSKSPLRFLEHAAGYVATVAQSPTYDSVLKDRPDLGILLPADATEDDWYNAIIDLVNDRKARYLMTKRAHAYVKQNHSIEQTKAAWLAAIDIALEA